MIPASLWNSCRGRLAIPNTKKTRCQRHLNVSTYKSFIFLFNVFENTPALITSAGAIKFNDSLDHWVSESVTGCRISLCCFHLGPNNSAWTKPALPDKHQPRGSPHWKNQGTRSTCTYPSFYVWMHLNLTHIYLSLFWLSPLGWKDCIWFCFPTKALQSNRLLIFFLVS